MPSMLITGANRGLGFELCRQYATRGWQIFACCREPGRADALKALAQAHKGVTLHPLDVKDFSAIDKLASELREQSIDVLVNNAGIYDSKGRAGFGHLEYDGWLDTLRVNTLAPIKMAEALAAQVARSDKKLIVAITSAMGSISEGGAGAYAYRTSKAALNMAMRLLANDLRGRKIGILIVSPGWVRTDMGGPGAALSVEQSVGGIRALIDRFDAKLSGRFMSYDGSELAW